MGPAVEGGAHGALAAALGVVTERHDQALVVEARGRERLAGAGETSPPGRHVLGAGQQREPPAAQPQQVLDGSTTAGPVVDVDDAAGVGPDHPTAADRGHAARVEDGGEVVVRVQREQQHPVDVLLGEVGGDVGPVAVVGGHGQQQLER